MSKTASIIMETLLRFDALKAIKVSRHRLKDAVRAEARAAGMDNGLAPSTGRIHSDKTLETYKGLVLRYVHWARDTQGVRHLEDLDARANLLVDAYLAYRLARGDAAHTLHTTRSALRMLHRPAYAELPITAREAAVALLGVGVILPKRRREDIVRSRGHVAMDDEFNPDNHAPMIHFCEAVGPRRRELAALVCGDVQGDPERADEAGSGLAVLIDNGKGGRTRLAPVIAGREDAVLDAIAGRHPQERIFARVPVRLDVHSLRRAYAQALYMEDGARPLPDPHGRLDMADVDRARALYVSRALGHSRLDVALRHYLR